jgi:hypothetical protein
MLLRQHVIVLLLFVTALCGESGQSAVSTLVLPYGARTNAMGEVGTALADDEAGVTFWNPAGLGRVNPLFATGAGSYFYEPIWPNLKIKDLWHTSIAVVLQPPAWHYYGGVGVSFHYKSCGRIYMIDDFGRYIEKPIGFVILSMA